MRELNLYQGSSFMKEFEGEHRFDFPEGIVRVTAGAGGEVLMILGSEKTAIIDCGMAYCARTTVKNIQAVLDNESERTGQHRTLDYIFATHTHYDHIGALADIKKHWPEAMTCAGEYAAKIFHREGAIRLIQSLSNQVAKQYVGKESVSIDFDYMHVDRILHEGDEISLGAENICILETPGHTNCSLTYILEPAGVMFLSESTGTVEKPDHVESQALKSYAQARSSIEKCKAYGAKRLVSPHYGIVPEWYNDTFWELALQNLEEKKAFAAARKGKMTEEEIIADYIQCYWTEERAKEQPFPAFSENAKHEMHAALAECEQQ